MGERGDIIKRMHRASRSAASSAASADFVWDAKRSSAPIIGRLVDRGLDDELKGSAYAMIDGVDGRTHHIRLRDLDAAGDAAPGAIVELRLPGCDGGAPSALAVRSDLASTGRSPRPAPPGSTGSSSPANRSRYRNRLRPRGRASHARPRRPSRRTKDLADATASASSSPAILSRHCASANWTRSAQGSPRETGLPFIRANGGEYVAGSYRQRFTLASGRFAMIDDGLGFSLVPWSPSLDKQLGRHVSGVDRDDGGIDWSFGRKRGIGL